MRRENLFLFLRYFNVREAFWLFTATLLFKLSPGVALEFHQLVRRERPSKIPTLEMLHLHRSRLGWSRTLLFYRHVPATILDIIL